MTRSGVAGRFLAAMSDQKRKVDKLRQDVAQIDDGLLDLLERRARAARAIGELVRGESPALPLRDRASVEALIARSKGDLPPGALRSIFHEIQAACVGLELSLRVAVLGPEGGAGHAAAREQFGASVTCLTTASADEALDAVTRQRADFALLPYETTADGPVQATILALTQGELRVGMVREVVPTLHLYNKSGRVEDVAKVYAVASDRALAARSLAELSGVAVVDAKSPQAACELAAADPTAAALANEAAGGALGLEIARRSMLDESHGRVRYAIVGARPSPRTGEDCTALVFSLHDAPGALFDVLRQFADHGVNLSRIQSRPALGDGWAYMFFLEVIGHATDRQIVSAFEGVKRLTKFFKVLGSYPARA
jgi:chorismate mutase/prephenate dehydratase